MKRFLSLAMAAFALTCCQKTPEPVDRLEFTSERPGLDTRTA